MRRVFLLGAGVLAALLSSPSLVAAPCEPEVGRFVSVEGTVELRRGSAGAWQRASTNEILCRQDTVRSGRNSRAALVLVNDAVLRVDAGTTLRLLEVSGVVEEPSLLDVLRGAIKSFSRKPRLIKVNSPYLNGTIEGTEFQLRVAEDSATLTVLEGIVLAANEAGSVRVGAGQAASARQGQAPQLRTLVRPLDAVQWTLFYPPVLAALGGAGMPPESLPREIQRAMDSASRGDLAAAFDELERMPAGDRNADFHVYRAALALSVGQVTAAQADIDQALALASDSSLALALRAVIAVVQNRREEALADGQRAVEIDPSAAARIALSYAQQASFQIDQARATLRAAVEAHPDNALAWARLGELELMLGNRTQASEAAAEAQRIAPDLSRTQLVRGYTALAGFDGAAARAAFERARTLSSADPLAHLGLGLAKISAGDLADGRQDLEVAVALDSSNALYRAYLGKAYFEEKRSPLDAEQFEIAKRLDPMDPTAYLYDGIRRQTENDPVEALRDIQDSIERNDKRAVYRGRLLLDQDRAARQTSAARAFDDLGFRQLGTNEASRSLALDPANASAHRFLSDSYRPNSRSEVSRVSDLLQSQLLQEININPIQQSVSSSNLNIVTQGGPADAGFNEFTPLFQRNEMQFDSAVSAGSDATNSLEGAVSGLYDRFSFSASGLSYDTDGFRENDGLSHDIYGFYAQAAVSETVNIQAEYTSRKTDRGDIAMKFDPQDFDPNFRRSLDADIWRAGLRISPSVDSTILLSMINVDRHIRGFEKDQLFAIPGLGSFDLRSELGSDDNTDQYDAQYLLQGETFNVTVGGAYIDVDREDTLSFVLETPFGDEPPDVFNNKFTIKDKRVYGYANFSPNESTTWTLGLSYEDYEQGEVFDFTKYSPKLGLQLALTDSVRVRGAYFRGVKPVLSSNRTLEPTQVAGFAQYFDDANATKFERYGLGVDAELSPDLSVGGEMSRRKLDWPVINANTGMGLFERRDEWTYRVYGYWTPADRWSASAELVFDKFDNMPNSELADEVPLRVTTVSVPLAVRYFHPSGVFASAGATVVAQTVTGDAVYTHKTGDSNFLVVNVGVGYRMPRRLGILSFSVQNLFDRDFDYLDNSYRTFEDDPSIGPYTPERTFMGKATFSF